MTVLQLVERERARLRRLHLAAGAALAAGATCALLALGVLALGGARWLLLPRSTPFVVWLLVLAADGAILCWTSKRLARAISRSGVAAEIEREQALRAGSLRGALETADSGALGRRAAEQLARRLDGQRRLAPSAHRTAQRRTLQTVAAALLSALLLGWAAPVFGDGLMAILLPVNAWRGTLLPKLAFRDLPTHVVRGEELKLDVLAAGRSQVVLSQRSTGEAWKSATLRTGSGGVARTTVGPVRADLTLVLSDGRSSSDTVTVRVTDRPFVGGVSMRAVYPAYLGRPSEGLPIGEPARVPQGTVVELSGRASTELSSIRLVGPDTVNMRASGHAFSGRMAAQRSGRWMWAAQGTAGPISDLPLPLELEVVPDSAPRVDILQPVGDTAVAGEERVSMRVAAADDHGVAFVELHSWRESAGGARQPVVSQRLTMQPSTVWSDLAELDLAPRGLRPGDVLHVKVVAADNSPWAQRGESRELLIKIPTMEERRSMARDAADSAARSAQSAATDQRAVEKHTDEAARERHQRPNRNANSGESSAQGKEQRSMSYEAAEQARAVAKEQRDVVDRVRDLQKQAAALEQQLEAAGALDSTLAQQLREAQDLLRQALTPELLAQMQKLEQSAQQLQGDQAQQAMKDLAAMQQRLREQLEKSAEMLKRAAYEGAMQTLKDEAREIAERERQLADSLARRNQGDRKAEAERLADRSERFAEDVKKLQQRLERDKAEAGTEKTAEATKRAQSSEEKMRDVARSLERQGQPREQQSGARGEQQERSEQARAGADSSSGERQAAAEKQGGEKQGGEKQGGEKQAGEKQAGEKQAAEKQGGEKQAGEKQAGDKQGGEKQAGEKQAGEKQGASRPGAEGQRQGENQSRNGQQGESGEQGQEGQQGKQGAGQQQARDAAAQMERASEAMKDARDAQVKEWKQELTAELDRAVQEMLQMAREESAMESKARSGEAKSEELRGQQSALKQGVDQTAERLQNEGKKSSLLSGRSQRAMAEAQQKVKQAMESLSEQRGAQAASSLGEAAESLNRAAASLARDRERANSASSASGFAEMLEQLQQLAKRQGSINSQAQGLMPSPGGQMSNEMQATARALARQQRQVAQQLEEMGDAAGGDRAAQLAKEARQLAEALDGGRVDAATVARQQQLFRRLLDAGRTLEKDEREDGAKREAKAATGDDRFTPENESAKGRDAQRFREPNWNELRGLTPEERRAILEYFKRINGQNP